MKVLGLIGIGLLTAIAGYGQAYAQNAIISIDNVTNTVSETQLTSDQLHRVSIRYDCRELGSENLWMGVNGFEVYSPDGADWGFLEGSIGPLVEGAGDLDIFLRHFNFDGSDWTQTGNNGSLPADGYTGGISRAGVYLATLSVFGTAGYVGGTDNDIALYLDFVTHWEDYGLTMCLDTNNQIATWEWAAGSAWEQPRWDNGLGVDGPRCWEISFPYCCVGRVGDANGQGGDEPTISDITAIVDAKFISYDCFGPIECRAEADVNQSGGYVPECEDITIADISVLIDYLFITGSSLGLPNCLY